MTQAPILGYPVPDTLFVLDTDASNDAIGIVLSQHQEGQEKVIARPSALQIESTVSLRRNSWLLSRQYSISNPIFMATILLCEWIIQHWSGCSVLKIERVKQFSEYSGCRNMIFDIQHQSQVKHNNADALSRQPCLPDCCKHCDQLEWRGMTCSDVEAIVPAAIVQQNVGVESEVETTLSRGWTDLRTAQLQNPDPTLYPAMKGEVWGETRLVYVLVYIGFEKE